MGLFFHPLMIPVAGFLMVVLIVAIKSFGKMREKELEAHRELRAREVEHERKMKELEVEKVRLELANSRHPKGV